MSNYFNEFCEYIRGAYLRQLTETSEQTNQPAWIRTQLRPHQRTLLGAARRLEKKADIPQLVKGEKHLVTSYGVLADRVGSGKSLVALSLVKDPPVQQSQLKVKASGGAQMLTIEPMPGFNKWTPQLNARIDDPSCAEFNIGSLMLTTASPLWYTPTALFIVPHNTASQWESYIQQQTTLRCEVIRKTRDCQYESLAWIKKVLTTDVVLVSCTMLKKFMSALQVRGLFFRKIIWSRVFFDEADTITCTLRPDDISARFMWFITGSWLNMIFPGGLYHHTVVNLPPDVQQIIGQGTVAGISSRVNIIAHTVSDCRDATFAEIILRNCDDWINKSLAQPQIFHQQILCRAPANLAALRDFIPPNALEALHAGDTAGALETMGLKANDGATVGDTITAALRIELQNAERILELKKEIVYHSDAAKAEGIKKAETKVKRLQEQLADLESRLAIALGSAADAVCPICYDAHQCPTLTPCCRQTFCLACICECIAKKPVCPMCRVTIRSLKELTVIGKDIGPSDNKVVEHFPAKGAALLRLLLDSKEDQRFLVFSAHEASFKGLREQLAVNGIRSELLQGSGPRVDRLRSQFTDGTIRILFLNARHVGAGINLEAATHVVMYHKMNIELEKQVIGRAVRFERKEPLHVIHLIHDQETVLNGSLDSEIIMHV